MGVSILGAVTHNLTQLFVANFFLIRHRGGIFSSSIFDSGRRGYWLYSWVWSKLLEQASGEDNGRGW
jgi:hypothetical protein